MSNKLILLLACFACTIAATTGANTGTEAVILAVGAFICEELEKLRK
jgi:Na+/H+ antiporter NhaC